eukprot:3623251-Prorocentrum_lima.AAC.1
MVYGDLFWRCHPRRGVDEAWLLKNSGARRTGLEVSQGVPAGASCYTTASLASFSPRTPTM